MPDPPADPVALQAGERHLLRLPGLGTAGYAWTYTVDGDSDAVEVTVGPIPLADHSALPPGASADELVTVTAKHPGRAVVHLTQRRSWEPEDAAVAHRALDVLIR